MSEGICEQRVDVSVTGSLMTRVHCRWPFGWGHKGREVRQSTFGRRFQTWSTCGRTMPSFQHCWRIGCSDRLTIEPSPQWVAPGSGNAAQVKNAINFFFPETNFVCLFVCDVVKHILNIVLFCVWDITAYSSQHNNVSAYFLDSQGRLRLTMSRQINLFCSDFPCLIARHLIDEHIFDDYLYLAECQLSAPQNDATRSVR